MMKVSPFRIAFAVSLALILWSLSSHSFAQGQPGGQAPSTSPPTGDGQQPGGRPPTGQTPATDRTRQPGQFPDNSSRMIYISGKVLLSDGTAPPTSVAIERVCNGTVRPEGYTDSKGNFSFQLGGQNGMFRDASIGADPLSQGVVGGSLGDTRGVSEREIVGCEIRANLAGFISDVVPLGFRRMLDDPDIGIIHIHPLEKVEGFTFSITTSTASKDARKAYENGVNNIKKRKWAEAEKELTKAVQSYPAYALAWYDLGRVYQQQNKLDDAHRAYQQAVEADSKFIYPYGQLALLAIGAQNWEDAAKHTSQMLKLNPYVTPDIYFYSAIANYNLQDIDLAEKHVQQAARLDAQHKMPRINHLLAVILAEKGDYQAAADNLRIYLKFTPNAPDAAAAKEQLADLEKRGSEK